MSDLPAVPDYYGQFMRPILAQQEMGIEQQQAQQQKQEFALKLQALAQAQQQRQQYQAAVQNVISNPTPEGYQSLMLQFPEEHDALQQSWANYSETEKQRDTSAAASVYAALSNDRPDLALSILNDRKQALSKAGQSTAIDDAVIQMLQSGDPAQIQKAKGIAGYVLASQAGPDKIGDVLGQLDGGKKDGFTLEPGQIRYDADGNIVAIGGAAKDGDAGGTAATTTPTDPKAAIAHSIGLEGGYNPKDANGSPTNWGINFSANKDALARMGINASNFRNMTKDQATQLYLQKYWPQSGAADLPANAQAPYFDVYIRNPGIAKAAWAKSNGDPQQFVQISNQMFQPFLKRHPQYASSYQQRFDANMAIAQGQGASADSGPALPPGFHQVIAPTAGKPPVGYEADPDHPGQLRPIKGGPADTSADAMDPATVTFYAQDILTGGQMPALGMGKAAAQNRRQIMEKVAQLAGAEGLSGKDLAVQIAHYKAGMQTVKTLETQLGAIQGNEATFAQNAAQVAQTAQKLAAQGNFRALNAPVQTYLRQTGDPDVAAADVAIKTAANEYARLMTASPSGAGTLSDSARAEYENILQGDFPLKQKIAALNQMAIDARNRSSSLRANLQSQYQHLTDRAPELRGEGGNSGGSAPVKVTSPAQAAKLAPGTLFQTPDGRILRKN